MRLIELKQVTEEELDESHPMTRMMLKAMGSKDPEEDIANARKPKKAYQTSKRAAGARKRPLVSKKMAEAEEATEEKCRGCGTTEPGARIDGLCKECQKDTYEDKD